MRGDVKSLPTGVQKETCNFSHGSILNVEVEGDCGGGNQQRCCSVGMFRPARWCRILSVNNPRKRVLGIVTNEHKQKEWKRDGMVAGQKHAWKQNGMMARQTKHRRTTKCNCMR